jgi:hypothetical protein
LQPHKTRPSSFSPSPPSKLHFTSSAAAAAQQLNCTSNNRHQQAGPMDTRPQHPTHGSLTFFFEPGESYFGYQKERERISTLKWQHSQYKNLFLLDMLP